MHAFPISACFSSQQLGVDGTGQTADANIDAVGRFRREALTQAKTALRVM